MADLDLNSKAAARSKWKASRRRQRGRGRGSWRSSTSTRSANTTEDLGNNLDRYSDEDETYLPPEGPVKRSQGGDFAEWLAQNPAHDTTFYARQRVDLNHEIGLPDAEPDAFQGLSFDLEGLAACLKALPLHDVLRLPKPLVEQPAQQASAVETGVNEKAAPKIEQIREQTGVGNVHSSAPKAAPTPAVARPPERPAAPVQPPPKPAAIPPAAPAQPPIESLREQSIPVTAAPPPPMQQATNTTSGVGVVDDEDVELEALLGLGTAPNSNAPASTILSSADTGGHSLEDWLDNL